jgi:hypothetical protein
MQDPLCRFGHGFPRLAAQILHRDRRKTRNFREETITDLIMAGLTAFEPFVRVDFPVDESKTGEDMDWEFVAPNAKGGRRYLRLHIQAKRAIFRKLKRHPSYWVYQELDHRSTKTAAWGSQAQRLIASAKARPGCVPLYMFYHTRDALKQQDSVAKLPAVDGVNLIFAEALAPVIGAHPSTSGKSRWPVADKKLEKWRPQFMALSDLLCFGPDGPGRFDWYAQHGYPDDLARFLADQPSILISPDAVARKLDQRRHQFAEAGLPQDVRSIEAVDEVPPETMRAIETWNERSGTAEIPRPRAIFLGDGLAHLTIDL